MGGRALLIRLAWDSAAGECRFDRTYVGAVESDALRRIARAQADLGARERRLREQEPSLAAAQHRDWAHLDGRVVVVDRQHGARPHAAPRAHDADIDDAFPVDASFPEHSAVEHDRVRRGVASRIRRDAATRVSSSRRRPRKQGDGEAESERQEAKSTRTHTGMDARGRRSVYVAGRCVPLARLGAIALSSAGFCTRSSAG